MFAIIGAGGNVGYATSRALRRAGMPVRAILRDAAKAAQLEQIGCEVALADLQDARSLASAIGTVAAVQVVVPLRPRSMDPAGDMRRSVESLIEALALVRPEQVLAISDYGAHVDRDIGMPSIFRDLEARLRRRGGRTLILRSAEHMHNWAHSIPAALATGILSSVQTPLGEAQPTIAAQDLGLLSAELLLHPGEDVRVVHAEGPSRYSAVDVANALGRLSGRPIHAEAIPRTAWDRAFAQVPASLAGLLVAAAVAKNAGGLIDVEPGGEVRYGTTGLIDALRPLLPSQRT